MKQRVYNSETVTYRSALALVASSPATRSCLLQRGTVPAVGDRDSGSVPSMTSGVESTGALTGTVSVTDERLIRCRCC